MMKSLRKDVGLSFKLVLLEYHVWWVSRGIKFLGINLTEERDLATENDKTLMTKAEDPNKGKHIIVHAHELKR